MELIATPAAPAAIGPYSQAVLAGDLLFCSGQIGLRPDGAMVAGGVAAQAAQALANLEAICAAAGTELARAVRTTIYLQDLADFALVNEVYAERFGSHRPARATVEVSAMPLAALVEIDAVVWLADPPTAEATIRL